MLQGLNSHITSASRADGVDSLILLVGRPFVNAGQVELVCALQDGHVVVGHFFLADGTQQGARWTARSLGWCLETFCGVHRDGHLLG